MKQYALRIKTPKGVKRRTTKSRRRFLYYTRLIPWQIKDLKVYLKVSDGLQKDHRGKMVEFYNDGDYINKKDFDLALNAFLEV